jgi:uncharacterized RmlC-like cupin family protein
MDRSSLPAMIYRPAQVEAVVDCGGRTCTHFHGEHEAHGVYVVCGHRGLRQVQATTLHGCAFWQREPGADG